MAAKAIFSMHRGGSRVVALAGLIAVVLLGYAASPVGPTAVSADTFTVTREDDPTPDGCNSGTDCSLREAIIAANAAGAGTHTINLEENGDYVFEILNTVVDEEAAEEGDLDVANASAEIIVQAPGAGATIDADFVDRVFEVQPDAFLSLINVTVTGGHAAYGGGIAVHSGGTLNVTDSIIERNTADGSALNFIGTGGGGIYANKAMVTSTGSIIRFNEARLPQVFEGLSGGAGGGGIYAGQTNLNITDSEILSNVVDATSIIFPPEFEGTGLGGGGIYSISSAVAIDGTIINDNEVLTPSGVIPVGDNNVNVAAPYGIGEGGGGIYAIDGLLTTSNHEFNHLEITDSIIDGNLASESDGGGLYVGFGVHLTLLRTTVSNNSATIPADLNNSGYGGGLYIANATADIENSTFSGNVADDAGGAIYVSDGGAADISFSTFSNNESPEGAAIGTGAPLPSVTLTFLANIIANSVGSENCAFEQPTDVVTFGYNISDDDTCELDHATDETDMDPLLGPLAFNGGFGWTHALLTGSPAIDFVAAGECPDTDERLVERPQDGDNNGSFLCDAGAYELESSASVLTVTKACPTGTGVATFTVLVGGDANVYACGTSLDYDVVAGDVTISEVISGPDTANYVTSIDCDDDSGAAGTSLTVTLAGENVACVITNIFTADGLTPEELEDLLDLELRIEILNILNNINQNVNTNDNTNENNNVNENTQNQTNDQDTNVTTGDTNVSTGGGAGTGTGSGSGSGTGTGTITITPPNTGSAGLAGNGTGFSGIALVAAIGLLGALSLACARLEGARS